ncbi:LysE family translocator [Chromobacterium sp. IIBBL 290-4]|uniref:LysE family translocator n=1 Tax=Chromobacterium sp. IIBBL 290-4 TaxID=2953890 RepID=UPI0020B71B49|nr:LysE family translocator [Chromobacterium sp. IIBBL 290-4]UTH72603.1 LysE family translocator [Chromobacterium sp. IIBBL 290-4]
MLAIHPALSFAAAALLMALTPGPNMIYLLSRTLCQGKLAGLVSLLGVMAGFACHLLATALGLSALFAAAPLAYLALKWAGAGYLGWMAWQAWTGRHDLRPDARGMARHSRLKLFGNGLLTSLLNPKVALFYLALLPQFIQAGSEGVLAQTLQLGAMQIAISLSVNASVVIGAHAISRNLARSPRWLGAQRKLMSGVFGLLAARLALDNGR